MVKSRWKYSQRYHEILNVLMKNGFGFFIKDLGPFNFLSKKNMPESSVLTKSISERIRLSLEQLGPTFIKLGQLASTRLDLIPADIAEELAKLQDHVYPTPTEEVITVIEKELGQRVDTLFLEFSPKPVASASIGQVYQAKLFDGSDVAVKVQRPNIEETIEKDLSILTDLARLMENRYEWARNYQLVDIVDELAKSLKNELDYTMEGKHAEKLRRNLQSFDNVTIPKIRWTYTTKKVLTMDFIHAKKFRQFVEEALESEKKSMANTFIRSMFHQIFLDGFFHGDPHPGNLFIKDHNHLIYIDFGMIGRIPTSLKYDLASMIIALKNEQLEKLTYLVLKVGKPLQTVDTIELHSDIEEIIFKYIDAPLDKISLGELVNDLLYVSFKHKIRMPKALTLLGKTLITMECIISELDSDLSMIDMVEPFGKELMKNRLKPKNVLNDIEGKIRDFFDMLSDTKKALKSLSKKGKFEVEMHVPEIESFIHKLDRISNQLSFSIVLLAFSILMASLIIGASISGQGTFLWDFPVIEVGSIVATLMFLWLLYGIFRSGRF
ncbi:ABC1 kinase family protein [Fervidibacillus halotolerans]|uniref:AarF/ABC1/UbiB kinase family protein n=1 Tax=Fervidibacillus halotolerans TaxID=2980027 RepID=A0A9E8RZ31_9BACI|nr:AarF/ABC1/UbiB kinase family protein [Fervidibacillus halotolerans]WAA13471.1 AarF/ABC1/UbiB kinase family protein [Fervidibacillus halotolerans]